MPDMIENEEDYPVASSHTQIPDALEKELVPVPEWRQKWWVHELSGGGLDEYRRGMYRIDGTDISLDMTNNTARLLALSMHDASGHRAFPDTEEGIRILSEKPAGGQERLAKVARRLSKLSDTEAKALVGNSAPGRTADSSSDSPGTSHAL